jgi:hypothetical protein
VETLANVGAVRHERSSSRALGELLAAIMVLLGVVGMAVSSPPLVGPDEAAHQATAYYTTVHILPPTAEGQEYTPGYLKHGACMAFNSEQDATCMPPRDDVTPGKIRVLNYPPPYYWVVGLGQKFAPTADTWMDVGGRVASMTLNLAGLLLLALLLRRRVRSWGTYLLAVSTPMAAFLWAVVNPNGWEITAGMIFVYFLARAWWDSDDILGRIPRPWVAFTCVAVASITFALSRHDAIVWLTLLVIAVTLTGTQLSRSRQLSVLAASALGLFSGLLWQLFYPAQHILNNDNPLANPLPLDYLHWFHEVDQMLPERIRQMVGVLGSLDVPVPQWMVLLLLITWGAVVGFLFARTRINPLFLILGFFGTLLVPSVLETMRWNDWPFWWQGRITLSFTIPFLFLLLIRYGAHGRRAIVVLSIVNGLVLTYMVWQNLSRYSFGVRNYIPLRGSDPAIGDFWFSVGMVIIALMLVATLARLWIFFRERRTLTSEVPQ